MAPSEYVLTVNGVRHTLLIAPAETLLVVLRDQLGLKGTKEACGRGDCGACTVIVDGVTVNACITLARRVRGAVVTIEGLAPVTTDLRRAFAERGAFQCGFCTPGMVVRASWLLDNFVGPWTRHSVRKQLAGNICRCTGYQGIVDAILDIHERMESSALPLEGAGRARTVHVE
jgi:aerobic-type carbon monoxide dehydrogenase small subunit (CoxS/CutS family)